jgi:hypothetical protein
VEGEERHLDREPEQHAEEDGLRPEAAELGGEFRGEVPSARRASSTKSKRAGRAKSAAKPAA